MAKKLKFNKYKLINFKKVINGDFSKELVVNNGLISKTSSIEEHYLVDCMDCVICPGFIDPQVNGFGKCNFWDLSNLTYELIDNLRFELSCKGVIAFCPTIITAPPDKILKTIDFINSYIKQSSKNDLGAKILGIHIEGIFITNPGVHDKQYINQDLSSKNVEPFIQENVILFTLAPELDKTGEAIHVLQKNNILVSIGHSNGNYKDGIRAINEFGLKTVTHMFNTLKGIEGFHHRDKRDKNSNIDLLVSKLQNEKNIDYENDGILLPLLKSKEVLCMVISDGMHVSKEVVKLLREYKDKEHFALVSDLVSFDFFAKTKISRTLGGGQEGLDICVKNLIDWKVSNLEDSLLSASYPLSLQLDLAKNLGLGRIEDGKEANIVIWDTKKNIVKGTIIGENLFLNN